MDMRTFLNLLAGTRAADHRAVFGEFAERLARMLARRAAHARVRAVEL
jgi:hypothetical protein